jgi:uncharacterized protein YciI
MWFVIALLALPAAAYDAGLAKRLGADERGMRAYVFVVLKTGPKADLNKEQQQALFKGHMANIQRLAAEGKLVLAGPFDENPQHLEGVFIFNLTRVEDAEALLKTDPAVAAGALAYEVYSWYGSAAVMEIPAIHQRIDKTQR